MISMDYYNSGLGILTERCNAPSLIATSHKIPPNADNLSRCEGGEVISMEDPFLIGLWTVV